jgi:UDP-N-acetylmuramate dehydrogenase
MDLRGLENLSHIPGTVGASAVQNVGAYGVEAKDVIMQVVVLNRQTLETETISAADCRFGYRYSRFKDEWRDRYIVLRVVYRLYKQGHLVLDYGNLSQVFASRSADTISPMEVREAIISIRRQKLPDMEQYGSAGSFFKNPVIPADMFAHLQSRYPDIPHFSVAAGEKIPAAWLIDKSGGKSLSLGGARVWDKQPLVIVNSADATPQDVMQLAKTVQQRVSVQFGIDLLPEVQYV